jgi:hypothetical protein
MDLNTAASCASLIQLPLVTPGSAAIARGSWIVLTGAPPTIPDRLWAFLNSALFSAVVATFVSAFAGTWGAQKLAERTARRKDLLNEMRGVNAALGFAFNIANTYIVTKKQHIQEIVTQYKKQCADRKNHLAGVAAGLIPRGTTFNYRLELKTISPPFSPVKGLETALSGWITPDGRAAILLTPLIQCIEGFADVATQRNAWINEVKNLPDNDEAHKACLYFGEAYAPNRVDDRYPEMMKAIERYTDDCIAFSILIAESLKKYGDRLAAEYGRGAPKIAKPDFGRAGDLLPDMKSYADWIGG